MKFRVYSDLHLELDDQDNLWTPPVVGEESEQFLILAGDIHYGDLSIEWVRDLCRRFKHVVMVFGNHDYWNTSNSIDEANLEFKDCMRRFKNFTLLHNEAKVIEDIVFYGGTCWTSMDRGNPLVEVNAHRIMQPDFTLIKGMSVQEWKFQHKMFINGLQQSLYDNYGKHDKFFVISHHLPSYISLSERYRDGNIINHYFYSDLDFFMEIEDCIGIWCHGHTHDSCEYMINKTKVICNPRGYDDGNREFNHTIYEY